MRRQLFLACIFLAVVSLLHTGCSLLRKNSTEQQPEIKIYIISEPDINYYDGKARAVQIRIIQLKNNIDFDRSGFASLWDNEDGRLRDDYCTHRDHNMLPADSDSLIIQKDSLAKYLGVIVAYKNNEKMASISLDPTKDIIIILKDHEVKLLSR